MKPGYKQTEVGVIPEEWEVSPLSELISGLDAGVSVNSVDKGDDICAYDESILKTSCVMGGKFFSAEHKKIATRDIHRAKCPLRKNTIVISRMNTPLLVGECGYVEQDYSYLFLPDRLWMTLHNVKKHPCVRWLAYTLSFDNVSRTIKESATGTSGSMKNISKGSLLAVRVPLPKQSEQEAIAAALGDADALIESLERLIAKKRDIKQGAMQELLTGQKRLPGFTGKWERKRLQSVLRFQVGFPFASAYFNEQGPGVRLVKNRDLKSDDQVYHYSGPYSPEFLVENGDVLVGMDGEFLPCLWSKGTALLNQRVGRIIPNAGLNRAFSYYVLIETLQKIENVTSSTTVKHLSHGDIEEIEMPLPKVEEQTAIAVILSDMDAEIVALEGTLMKARAIKQGMMQELLTGRIRLV